MAGKTGKIKVFLGKYYFYALCVFNTYSKKSFFHLLTTSQMKLPALFCTAALSLAASFTFAQRSADWSLSLTGNAQQIILQNLTGVPIIQTDKAYIGIDPAKQQIAWTVERKAPKLAAALNGDGYDFYNLAGTPFVLINNSILESRTGTPIISKEKNDYKTVDDYEVIPALNSVLVRVTAPKGVLRLYLIGMADAKVKWETDVMKPALITGMNEEPEEDHIDVPLFSSLVSPDHYLIYSYRKNLAVISPEGKLLWSEKADPAEVLLSPDGKKVLTIKALVTGIGNSPVMVRYVTKYRSNKMEAFDLKTGKAGWKDDLKANQNIRWADAHPGFLTVVWKNGCNIYSYTTGEAIWKDDFKGKRVVEIQPNDKGYLVTFESGYKSMQLDKTGNELWKKPQIVETDDDTEELPDDGDMNVYYYAKGKILVNAEQARFRPAKGSGLKKWRLSLNAGSRIAYDDSLHNLIILHDNRLHILNPDSNPQVDRVFKDNFENLPAFHTVEFRDNAYFMTSSKEFIVFERSGEKLTHHYYVRPFDVQGMFLSMLDAKMATDEALLNCRASRNAQAGAAKAERASAGLLPPGSGNTEINKAQHQLMAADALNYAASLMPPARFEAFKQSQNFAWYFTKDKNNNVLVKVNKDTGAEADKLILDDARPVYQLDDIQKRVYYANKNVLKVFNM